MDQEHYTALAAFRYALRQFMAASETISRQAGVTQQQYQAMLAIRTWTSDSMAMKDLSEQLRLTHHATVQMVDRLSKLDLAERHPSREDRRSVVVRLTEKGERLLDGLAGEHLRELRRREPVLTSSLRRLKRLGE